MVRHALISVGLPLFLMFSMVGCEDDTGGPTPDAAPRDGAPSPDGMSGDRPPADTAPVADRAADTVAEAGSEAGAGDGPGPDAPPLSEQQLRGKYLVENVIACPECHTPRLMTGELDMSKYMAGDTACFVKLPNNDCIYVRNLTPDPTGLLNRSNDEIKKMILEGKRPAATGEEALHPIMPYYTFANMDPEDADAIVAFLRTLRAVRNEIPRRGVSFDVPMPAPAIDMSKVPVPGAAYPNKAAAMRGRYLATQIGLCVECHTPHLMAGPTALDETKFFQGGEEFPLMFGALMVTARSKNLTPDMTTGLGSWSIDDIVKVLKLGKDKMDKGICPPMPVGPMGSYGGLTQQDARDIAHYLKSIPAVTNMVMDMCSFPPGT